MSVFLVPHTHWDREWYRPFQSFRISLVDVVDEVLQLLEADDRMRFTLDGQLATVDDYLAIRPESEERLRRLVADGRLAIGPWQTLVDEFLVSGETIMRNLEAGLARAAELGGAMRVGYLPDSFGHVAQMPQILRSFGIESAVVWRGVPGAIDHHLFEWESPDGTAVRAEYLPEGYSNAAYLFNTPEPRLGALEERLRAWFGADPVLAMVGTDHMPPVRRLAERIPENAPLGTVDEYVALTHTRPATTRWRGELRSAARANLLPNVTSARVDLKAACSRAERAIERYAEPLHALYGEEWPQPFLDEAWDRLLQNAAHDSICGCSADEVSAQVLVRYAEAEQIGLELARRAVARIAADVPHDAFVIVNPSPFERRDLVELDVAVPERWDAVALECPSGDHVPTQELRRQEPLLWESQVAGGDVVRRLHRRMHGRELFGRILNGYDIRGRVVTMRVGDVAEPESLDVAELLREVELATQDGKWTLRIAAEPRRRVLAAVVAPALGFTSVRPVEAVRVPGPTPVPAPLVPAVRIVRGGDAGDSYNYAPAPDDVLVDTPVEERSELVETGPLRTVVVLTRIYRWGAHDVVTETRYEHRSEESLVRIEVSFDNPCDDQRVRAHVPLEEESSRSFAEGQFAVAERPPASEGGYGEEPVGTYPASAFVHAGGVTVLLEHVTEYELVDGRELALTALRSIGLISRSTNPWREEPAGPELPIPAAQLRGRRRFAFAWSRLALEDAAAAAESYRLPFVAAPGRARTGSLRDGRGLSVTRASLTSLRRRNGELEARVVNGTGSAVSATVGETGVELGPWEIRSVRLPAGAEGAATHVDGDRTRAGRTR